MSQQPDLDRAELESLLALDALDADEQLDAEHLLGTLVSPLAGVTADLAELVALDPPAAWRADVLGAAVTQRAAGASTMAAPAIAPLDALAWCIDDLRSVLDELTPADWAAPAHAAYGSVHDLVAHLVGVEELVRAWCTTDAVVGATIADDHVAATMPTVAAHAATPDAALARQWHDSAREAASAAAAVGPARPVLVHDIPTDVDGMVVLRCFELWSHADDIRRATGRPLPAPDPAVMSLLSQRLLGVLPLAFLFRGVDAPAAATRFVLTGPGGGTYDVALTDAPHTDATLVVDVVDLCRVAAARLAVDELRWSLEGDAEVAALTLAQLDAFARD